MGGTVTIACKDRLAFPFPWQDCLLLPIIHTMAEEQVVYLYRRIQSRLDANYLLERWVKVMEVMVSEAIGHEAGIRRAIPQPLLRLHDNAAAARGEGGRRTRLTWCFT